MLKTKQLIGYKPMAHQIAVHKLVREFPKGHTISVLSRRQCGKSLMAQNILLDVAINRPNTESIYIGPTFKHCKKVYKELVKAIKRSGCIQTQNNSDFIITFTNDSTIQFLSAAQRENLRGYTVTGIRIIDEAAFIDDDVFDITDHFCNVHNTSTVLISTPLFTAGRFYESYQKGLIGIKGYKSIDWKNYDLSRLLSEELIEKYRLNLPPKVFKTEVLGEFVTGGGLVFENFLDCVYNGLIKDLPTFCGIDFATAKGTDYTILTYMNNRKEVLFQTEHKESSVTIIIDNIINELNMYSNLKIMGERNGIGDIYIPVISSKLKNGNKINEFTTSNKSKNDIINELIVAFEQKQIKIPNDPKLLKELELFSSKYNEKTRLITYAASVGNDDRVMSLAIAYYLSKSNKGNYSYI